MDRHDPVKSIDIHLTESLKGRRIAHSEGAFFRTMRVFPGTARFGLPSESCREALRVELVTVPGWARCCRRP
jgi:hypothetical protein